MNQREKLNSVMESGNHIKNGVRMKRIKSKIIETNMTIFSFLKIALVFALFFIYGCNKENNPIIDELTISDIQEIIYCPPDLNDTSLQARIAIITQNQAIITYEYTGKKKDSISCIFYYDKIENQGYYWVFSKNKTTQFLINSQDELDNYVFEAETTDSLIYFRKYEYDWKNDEATILGEYYFPESNDTTSEYIQLRSSDSSVDDIFQLALDKIKEMKDVYKNKLESFGKARGAIGDASGKTTEKAANNIAQELDDGTNALIYHNNPSTNPNNNESVYDNIIFKINNFPNLIWDPFLNNIHSGLDDFLNWWDKIINANEKIKDYSTFTLSKEEIDFKKEGGTDFFTINTNLTITIIPPDQGWCKYFYNENNKIVTITADPNTTNNPRPPATISVWATYPSLPNGRPKEKRVTINQEGGDDNNEDWVEINGVKWATRNVGAPGTFVANPEDYGEYYQWCTMGFLLPEDFAKAYANTNLSSWLPANDPSPTGYRVPTWPELESLINTTYVINTWTTRNGVNGRIVTDKASGKSIFLPWAGMRKYNDGSFFLVGECGFYWTSTQTFGYNAYILEFSNSPSTVANIQRGDYGLSVRPVKN